MIVRQLSVLYSETYPQREPFTAVTNDLPRVEDEQLAVGLGVKKTRQNDWNNVSSHDLCAVATGKHPTVFITSIVQLHNNIALIFSGIYTCLARLEKIIFQKFVYAQFWMSPLSTVRHPNMFATRSLPRAPTI